MNADKHHQNLIEARMLIETARRLLVDTTQDRSVDEPTDLQRIRAKVWSGTLWEMLERTPLPRIGDTVEALEKILPDVEF